MLCNKTIATWSHQPSKPPASTPHPPGVLLGGWEGMTKVKNGVQAFCTCQSLRRSVCLVLQDSPGAVRQRSKTQTTQIGLHHQGLQEALEEYEPKRLRLIRYLPR